MLSLSFYLSFGRSYLCCHYPTYSCLKSHGCVLSIWSGKVALPEVINVLFVHGLELLGSYQLMVLYYFSMQWSQSCPCPPNLWSLTYGCFPCPWVSSKICLSQHLFLNKATISLSLVANCFCHPVFRLIAFLLSLVHSVLQIPVHPWCSRTLALF